MPSTFTHSKRRLASAGLILGPLLFLAVDVWMYGYGQMLGGSVAGLASMLVWVPAVMGLYHLLRSRSEPWALVAGGTALVGLLAVVAIITGAILRLMALQASPGSAEVREAVNAGYARMGFILPFGVLFPLGLLLFAIGLARHGVVPRWSGVFLVAGAILYPAGRIPSVLPVLVASDLALALGFGWLGVRLLTHPRTWEDPARSVSTGSQSHPGGAVPLPMAGAVSLQP